MKNERPIVHLLIPKEFRVWCRPKQSPGNLSVTNQAGKTTCARCLTEMRGRTQGNWRPFRTSHTGRASPIHSR